MTVQPPFALPSAAMAEHLLAGGAGVMPTDTLPALVASPAYAAQLWMLKQRPEDKPLILMAATADALLGLVAPEAQLAARSLTKHHWPGALTLVMPVALDDDAQAIRACLNPGSATLGFRVPASIQARDLLSRTGPLATTSANPSGEVAALNADQARCYFPRVPVLEPLTWPQPLGVASTVLAWTGGERWQILRQGAVMPAGVVDPPPCSG